MSTAYLFPGQGSQFVGMGADLHASSEIARTVFEEADRILGFSISSRMFGTGDEEADTEFLKQTDNTQPALFVHSIAALRILEANGERFDAAAGHSLGEYTALTAAGALTFEDGLRTVKRRGELMAGANVARPGGMAAVLGVDDEIVEEICQSASTDDEIVQPANYNAPGQIVISGDSSAVERAMQIAEKHGARRVIALPVSGAFHSPLMEHARSALGEALSSLTIVEPRVPVYLNVSARPATEPDVIRNALLDQLTSPVRWSQTITNMTRDGVTSFVEVGAGKVLSGLVRRTLGRDVEVKTAGAATDFDA